MNKKYFKIVTAVALTLILATGTGIFKVSAASVPKDDNKNECKMEKHPGIVHGILKNDLGFTDEDIKSAEKSGKNVFDLAKQKGISQDKLKEMIIDKQSKKVDEDVVSGKIPKEKADEIKSHFKEKISKWDGNLKIDKHRCGMHNPVYGILKKDLGFTDEEIKSAADSGKTAFDLAKQKGISHDKLKEMIIDKETKNIDKAVTDGKIPKEKADEIKSSFKSRIQNWDGSLKHKK